MFSRTKMRIVNNVINISSDDDDVYDGLTSTKEQELEIPMFKKHPITFCRRSKLLPLLLFELQ